MQWSDTPNAGFTKSGVTPWLPVPPTYTQVNVKAEESQPNSMLDWYKTLIQLKKTNPAFSHGENVMLDTANDKVLSWLRQAGPGKSVVVSVNFTADPQTVSLSIPTGTGANSASTNSSGSVKTLLKTPGSQDPTNITQFQLGPYGVYIGELQ